MDESHWENCHGGDYVHDDIQKVYNWKHIFLYAWLLIWNVIKSTILHNTRIHYLQRNVFAFICVNSAVIKTVYLGQSAASKNSYTL